MSAKGRYEWRFRKEFWIWIIGITALYFLPPAADGHFSFCLFRILGFHFCPGCGLGSSIHAILHGDWQQSLQYHWLGFPALAILLIRIIKLANQKTNYGKLDDELSGSPA